MAPAETKASLLGWRVTEAQADSERRGRGRRTGRERVALSVPLWLDSHLVTMCDRSSGANDGLPEASSIRPGLTGLPEREAQREMPIDTPLRRVNGSICAIYGALLSRCAGDIHTKCVWGLLCACESPLTHSRAPARRILWPEQPPTYLHAPPPPPERAKTN